MARIAFLFVAGVVGAQEPSNVIDPERAVERAVKGLTPRKVNAGLAPVASRIAESPSLVSRPCSVALQNVTPTNAHPAPMPQVVPQVKSNMPAVVTPAPECKTP